MGRGEAPFHLMSIAVRHAAVSVPLGLGSKKARSVKGL